MHHIVFPPYSFSSFNNIYSSSVALELFDAALVQSFCLLNTILFYELINHNFIFLLFFFIDIYVFCPIFLFIILLFSFGITNCFAMNTAVK